MPAQKLTERAELYLCVARAFLPPMEVNQYRAMREYLADDLADLSTELGYSLEANVHALRDQLQGMEGHDACLQLYSRLFLVPPIPAHLNAGIYIDGVLMGASVSEIDLAYHQHGLEKSPNFCDTPDHITSLLEFVAYLFAVAHNKEAKGDTDASRDYQLQAGTFLRYYVASWLPGLINDLAYVKEIGPNSLYAELVDFLQIVARHDIHRLGLTTESVRRVDLKKSSHLPDNERRGTVPHTVCCAVCAESFAVWHDVYKMRRQLNAQGLATDYLDICPRCRAADIGFSEVLADEHTI
ncbi:MAG: molecular chaperone TorD family protein [Gammaproteobacteria bacterium]|nr:molecular chaperone TorD family protein [Gammaproteobacteria bacterium]MDH5801588.1 molecular chaperone TorD family protein [Gammaproteobacteria bacterium]